MKKKLLYTLLLCLGNLMLHGQTYSTNKYAHSHNDYERSQPFYMAYKHRFASIEIDVFLVGDDLYVAHNKNDIDTNLTIEKLYIQPMLDQIQLNKGKAYPDGGNLQFLIDLKTAAEPTLRCLERKLKPLRHYFDMVNNPHAVRLVISGNMPAPENFHLYDDIFYFDGRSAVNYTAKQLERVALFSAPLQQFSKWNGIGQIPQAEFLKVTAFTDSVHHLKKKVRFWGTPDTRTLWRTFLKLGVDYLNTDSPAELAAFLDTYDKD